MLSARHYEIKRVKKANNKHEIRDRKNKNFNPAHEFSLVYQYVISNLNKIVKCACLDQTIDKSS